MNRQFLLAAAAAVALLLVGCFPGIRKPNLLVISIDSLRADHVGSYGYPRPTTERMDAFGAAGARFDQAIAQAPWTTPSMISFMTSLYPSTHGVDRIQRHMKDSHRTLAEILRENGYRTAAVVPFVTLWSYYGLNRGFEDFHEEYFDHDSLSSRFLAMTAEGWIRRHRHEPFFYWVHFWDPHYNYRPSREVRGRFVPEETSFGERVFDIQDLKWRENPLSPAEVAYNIDRYDEEILFTDRNVGRLLDFLSEIGLESDTLVVILSDHGEQFQEHGWLEHTNRVYDNLIRVPLFLRFPDRVPAGLQISRQVELIDMVPTLLDLLGVGRAGESFQGRSLAKELSGGEPPEGSANLPAFSETARLADLKTVRYWPWKYIRDFKSDRAELYRIDLDPGETRDLIDQRPEKAAEMSGLMDAWLGHALLETAAPEGRLTPDMIEKLRSLGYLR